MKGDVPLWAKRASRADLQLAYLTVARWISQWIRGTKPWLKHSKTVFDIRLSCRFFIISKTKENSRFTLRRNAIDWHQWLKKVTLDTLKKKSPCCHAELFPHSYPKWIHYTYKEPSCSRRASGQIYKAWETQQTIVNHSLHRPLLGCPILTTPM